MTWLQMIPDNTGRVITVMYYENGKVKDRDELDDAYASGDITRSQYEAALEGKIDEESVCKWNYSGWNKEYGATEWKSHFSG